MDTEHNPWDLDSDSSSDEDGEDEDDDHPLPFPSSENLNHKISETSNSDFASQNSQHSFGSPQMLKKTKTKKKLKNSSKSVFVIKNFVNFFRVLRK